MFSGQSESTFLSHPDTNFHCLLLGAATLFLSLLSSRIFYGHPSCSELFASFSSIWRLRTSELVSLDPERRRRTQLILEQLRTGSILTRQYSLYHGLGLLLDSVTLLLVNLYTLHYFDWSLPTPYFAVTRTQDDVTACHMPNRQMYRWFGVVATFVMTLKVRVWFLVGVYISLSRHLIASSVSASLPASPVCLAAT